MAGLGAAVGTDAAAAPPTSEPRATFVEPDVSFDVDAARSGFDRVIDEIPDRMTDPPTPCPVAELESVNDAVATAGLATIDDWTWGPSPSWMRDYLLGCVGERGERDGDGADPAVHLPLLVLDLRVDENAIAFIEVEATDFLNVDDVELEAMETSGLPDGTYGFCYDFDNSASSTCHEFWPQDGFVVGVYLTSNEAIDRGVAATVLGELLPVVIADLTAA